MDERDVSNEKEGSPEITKNQQRFLSFSDFLIILVIIIDLLYVGELLVTAPGNMLLINVVSVTISYVAYELKKRIRKINRRKKALDESTSQEAQH